MRVLLIPADDELPVIEANVPDDDKLTGFYALIECSLIDIAEHDLNGQVFDIVVDDEGAFAADRKINRRAARLTGGGYFGNVVVCGQVDAAGESTEVHPSVVSWVRNRGWMLEQPAGSVAKP